MVFDAHVHTLSYGRDFSPRLAEYYLRLYEGEVSWITGRPWRAEDWCVPGPNVVEHMDAASVDRALIMALASVPLDGYDPELGEYIADLCDTYPDRFVGFYSANPTGGDEEAERLRRAVHELGLRGLKMLPSYNGVPLNDARIRPLYAAAEELGVPVLLHTGWSPFPGGRTLANDHPLQLEDVLVEFPRLRAIVGHCGFTWSEHVLMLLAAHPGIGADLAYWGPTQPPWRAAQTLSMAKHLGVLDRLFWGTDYPFTSFADDLAYWRRVPATCERLDLEPAVSEAEVERFLGANFARFLERKEEPA